MSKTFQFERFDIDPNDAHERIPAADGAYVYADDAIDREAVLQAQIRTLETQLKDARAFAHLARDAALEEAASIAENSFVYATTTAQCIAKNIRQKKEKKA
jgi:hypothetical protein